MKKSLCVLFALVILLFNLTAFAQGETDIAYNTESDAFDYSEFRIYMSSKVSQKVNESFVFVTSLYEKGNMISLDYCVKPVGENTMIFDTSLTLPDDLSNVRVNLVVLRKDPEGLSFVNKASYGFTNKEKLTLIPQTNQKESNYPVDIDVAVSQGVMIDREIYERNSFDGKNIISYLSDGRSINSRLEFFRVIKRKPLDVPYVETPAQKPLDGKLNIVYNGEYMYSLVPPVVENDNVYIPVQNALNALGFKFSFENGMLTGTKDNETISLKRGSNTVKYNGKAYRLKKAVKNDNTEMVSLTELAKIVGKECTYNSNENVCLIKDKEASR